MRRTCVIIDTREQKPLDLGGYPHLRTLRAKLWPGDYSLQAASRFVAIERKSVNDLIGTMCTGYAGIGATSPKRFDCELLGLGGIIRLGGRAMILVEPDMPGITAEKQISEGLYQSAIPPAKILAFIDTIRNGWKIPVLLANSRQHAADIVAAMISLADKEKQSRRDFERKWRDLTAPPIMP